MNQDMVSPLTLELPTLSAYLPLATQFVEAAAGVFGLEKEGALRLELATEEIFVYLSNEVCHGESLKISCLNGISYARVEFRFTVSALNMGALNMTATCSNEDDMAEMGLMIASRSVDRLHITAEKNQSLCLAIEKDKRYPVVTAMTFSEPVYMDHFTVETPDTETLKRFVVQAAQDTTDRQRTAFFRYPGRVTDMVAAGHCQALLALTPKQEIVGGMLLFFRTERIVEMMGPYCFCPVIEAEIDDRLLSDCLSMMARTRAIALLNRTGLPLFIQPQFESLGVLQYCHTSGDTTLQPVFYRMLNEDPGSIVWTDVALKDYLTQEYGRLYLAREIREVQNCGETKTGASIFSAEMKRELSEVILRPLWPGADAADNVKKHIRCLCEESLLNIFFEIDLGISWHASLIPILMVNGFRPSLIIPFAGQADIVVFQYHEH
jgi:anti-sigma regulatory factor (Ser/Thr protein kinase)